MAPPPELDRLLTMVCRNEAIPSYREFEGVLIPVARGLLAGWTPALSGFQGLPRQRAGYLVDVLAGWMDDGPARAWRPVLDRLATGLVDPAFAPFFHGDPVLFGPGQDDVARLWGLARGLNVARLRQALAPPYLC